MSDPFDAAKIAAECKDAADKKARKSRRKARRGDAPLPPVVHEEASTFVSGEKIYDPAVHDEIARAMALQGASTLEIAEEIGVTVRAVQKWRNRHASFHEALRVGYENASDRVERNGLFERAIGYEYLEEQVVKLANADGSERVEIVQVRKQLPPDPYAALKWLVNRRRGEWADSKQVSVGGTIMHTTPAQARRELADFFGQTVALPAPEGAAE